MLPTKPAPFTSSPTKYPLQEERATAPWGVVALSLFAAFYWKRNRTVAETSTGGPG